MKKFVTSLRHPAVAAAAATAAAVAVAAAPVKKGRARKRNGRFFTALLDPLSLHAAASISLDTFSLFFSLSLSLCTPLPQRYNDTINKIFSRNKTNVSRAKRYLNIYVYFFTPIQACNSCYTRQRDEVPRKYYMMLS
jgi:hypothetical protein